MVKADTDEKLAAVVDEYGGDSVIMIPHSAAASPLPVHGIRRLPEIKRHPGSPISAGDTAKPAPIVSLSSFPLSSLHSSAPHCSMAPVSSSAPLYSSAPHYSASPFHSAATFHSTAPPPHLGSFPTYTRAVFRPVSHIVSHPSLHATHSSVHHHIGKWKVPRRNSLDQASWQNRRRNRKIE